MTQTAYVVTRGEYSDYQVIAVFTQESLAKEMARLYGREAMIEKRPLDEVPKHPPGYLYYRVYISRNGDTEVERNNPPWTPAEEVAWRVLKDCYGGTRKVTYCWALEEKHAAKIANERRTALIAQGGWD